jgi:hypothetical protein
MPKRLPEYIATAVRKVEPVGGGMVRVYYALERSGAWDDQVTILMPIVCIAESNSFVAQSAQEIAAETSIPLVDTRH